MDYIVFGCLMAFLVLLPVLIYVVYRFMNWEPNIAKKRQVNPTPAAPPSVLAPPVVSVSGAVDQVEVPDRRISQSWIEERVLMNAGPLPRDIEAEEEAKREERIRRGLQP